ncbi:hypothetical protein F0562_025672 [Nyssa sinensis]|uniref:MYB-CC type transcription factor LHEQLE-containing domain-containing protein n=1 Tax=Nyssa sinensis TaxID=561372 RepID=A0A5J5B953_9ASTE|nr:hypothetical protein F0562_025672 [Nyssa sinensis]
MGITEALRLQMEVQKQLHEQLEGRFLQMIFEKQRKMDDERSKASSSNPDESSPPLSNATQPSLANDKLEASSNASPAPEAISQNPSEEETAAENKSGRKRDLGARGSSPRPAKRARADETTASS